MIERQPCDKLRESPGREIKRSRAMRDFLFIKNILFVVRCICIRKED